MPKSLSSFRRICGYRSLMVFGLLVSAACLCLWTARWAARAATTHTAMMTAGSRMVSGNNVSRVATNIVDTGGAITADIAVTGGATSASFTLQASDGVLTATDRLNVTVVPPPTLGNYADTSVTIGASASVTPDAAPTSTTGLNVATSTNFNGTLAADPATGVVRVTDAHPAGAYTVTVTAFNSAGGMASKTFTLTVQRGTACASALSFTNAADVSVGSNPRAVAIGDFNNDGKQDIAVANANSPNVSIRLGDGSGGFSGATNVSVGRNPTSVAIGDFNNDGKQDFAVANTMPDTVSIRLGDGAGNFSVSPDVSVGHLANSVAIGDFNSDGKPDLAVANIFPNTVSIRLGDGAGNFGGTTEVSVGTQPWSVAIGDFNNDGKQDFATANRNPSTVSIRLGDGAGNFSGTTEVSVGTNPLSVAIGDFNNDGKQDFATANFTAVTVSIRLGDGTGNFGGTTEVSVDPRPQSMAEISTMMASRI